jgi:hypothetical protein
MGAGHWADGQTNSWMDRQANQTALSHTRPWRRLAAPRHHPPRQAACPPHTRLVLPPAPAPFAACTAGPSGYRHTRARAHETSWNSAPTVQSTHMLTRRRMQLSLRPALLSRRHSLGASQSSRSRLAMRGGTPASAAACTNAAPMHQTQQRATSTHLGLAANVASDASIQGASSASRLTAGQIPKGCRA